MINLKFFDTVRMLLRTGKVGDEYVQKTQIIKIVRNKAGLEELPDYQYHVRIEGYTEVNETTYNITRTIEPLQFYVNYENGMIYFNPSEEGKTLTVDYKGRGYIQYPAERIYVHNDKHPIDEQYPYAMDNLQGFLDYIIWKTDNFSKFIKDKTTEIIEFVKDKKNELNKYVDEKIEYIKTLASDYHLFIFEKTEELIEFSEDTKGKVNEHVDNKIDEYELYVDQKYHEYIDFVEDYVEIADGKIDEMDFCMDIFDIKTRLCEKATKESKDQTEESRAATENSIKATEDATDVFNQCTDLADDLEHEMRIAREELADLEKAIISTRLIMQAPVSDRGDIEIAYPNPEVGWGVQTEKDGNIYRWNGIRWQYAYNLQGSIVLATEEMNGLMAKEMVYKLKGIEENAQVNFRGEEAKNVLPDDFRTRTVVFVLSGNPAEGAQGVNIQVPFAGKITEVRASCTESGSTNTGIDIEKASNDDFLLGRWQSIFSTDSHMIIPSNEKRNISYKISDSDVEKKDYFRINIKEVGRNISNITIQLDIKL